MISKDVACLPTFIIIVSWALTIQSPARRCFADVKNGFKSTNSNNLVLLRDYVKCKEAKTKEIISYKRMCQQKIATNIKEDGKS